MDSTYLGSKPELSLKDSQTERTKGRHLDEAMAEIFSPVRVMEGA